MMNTASAFAAPFAAPPHAWRTHPNRACTNTKSATAARTPRPLRARCCAYGAGVRGEVAIDATDGDKLLHVVFVHPQIHWNTGNMGRTCLGLGAALHLVAPLGFSLDDKQVRRAGLDYWQHVDVRVHDSWMQFANGPMKQLGGTRLFFTKFGDQCASEMEWNEHGKTVLVFGSEVNGFDGIRDWLESDDGKHETRVAFPMVHHSFRSFNLSTTASMALWDAYKHVRQRQHVARARTEMK